MSQINASSARDNNRVPIVVDGVTLASNNQVFSGNNTTVYVPIFTITGTVEIRGLWGVVTTTMGVNHTAAYFRINDQTANPPITKVTGVTLSGLAVGTTIVKKDVVANAVTLLDNAAGRVSEPTTLETTYFSPFVVMKKTGALTQIEYSYATTDAGTTGAMTFYARFIPLSQDGNLTIV
jgi:hypothetical protein